jgi:hypothetical protein
VGRALGETDPWGDGSVSGLIGLLKCPTYSALMQVESSKKMLFYAQKYGSMSRWRPICARTQRVGPDNAALGNSGGLAR